MLQIVTENTREVAEVQALEAEGETHRLGVDFVLAGIQTGTPSAAQTTAPVLAALLEGGGSLTFTHCLRPGGRYWLNVALDLPAGDLPDDEAFERLIAACLPGLVRAQRRGEALHDARHHLAPPALSPVRAVFPATPPGPACQGADRVDLFLSADTSPDVERALAFLIRRGLPCDLVLRLARWDLSAPQMRALHSVKDDLLAGNGQAGTRIHNPFKALEMAQRIERLLAAPRGLRLTCSLHLAGGSDPALAAIVAGLLFGAVGRPDAPVKGQFDFSERVEPTRTLPAMAASPLAIAQALHRAPRLPVRGTSTGRDDLCLGVDESGVPVLSEAAALRQHLYVVGGTGTGKTTLLQNLISQDIAAGRGVYVIDPHGDLHDALLANMPTRHRDRLIVADAGDFANPFTLNILEASPGPHAPIQRNFIANQLVELFKMVYGHNPEAFGPMFEMYFRGALLLLMDAGGETTSLSDMNRLFGDREYRNGLLERCTDTSVASFWRDIATRAGGEASLENIAPYIVAKLTRLEGNPLLRPILCAGTSSLDIRAALDKGKIVLVNLAKGLVGGPDAALLGGIITIRLFAAAMARAAQAPEQRRPVRVYLDEFQTHALGVLGDMLSEARKFGLSLVLANQSIAQLDQRGDGIAQAILANAANLMAFRIGPADAEKIGEWLGPDISPRILTDLPNYHMIARLLTRGRPAPAALVRTLPADPPWRAG